MKKTLCGMVLAAGLSGLLLAPSSAEAQGAGLVRIGLPRTLFRGTPESIIGVVMRPFKTLLEGQTGVAGEVVSAADSTELARQLAADKIQLGVFHGFEFAWVKLEHPDLEPLVIAVNQQPELRALLVVRADNKAESYADLQGKVIALPVQTREHCKLFFDRRCVKPGMSAKRFYAELSDPDDTDEALHDVFERKAAAAVVDSVAFEEFKARKAARGKQLKILSDSGSLPCAVVAVKSGRFDADLVARFQKALLSARESASGKKMLEMIRLTGFAKVPVGFDKQLTESARNYPPTTK